jgi:hypothetical protein
VTQGYAEFEFDLPAALQSELIALLDRMSPAPLNRTTTTAIDEVQGVYQLFHNGNLVYIGKTDAEAGLKTRLSRHAKKVLHRPSFTGDVQFKAVRIMVFAAMDLETQLIKHYRSLNTGAASWNGSGFGSNDPGRERETTNKPPQGFDPRYPIDIDLPGDFVPAGYTTVAAALAALKAALPYTIRYETLRSPSGRALPNQPHPDLVTTQVIIPAGSHTVRDLLTLTRAALGPDWQATQFVSHVILYKENRTYKYGTTI